MHIKLLNFIYIKLYQKKIISNKKKYYQKNYIKQKKDYFIFKRLHPTNIEVRQRRFN